MLFPFIKYPVVALRLTAHSVLYLCRGFKVRVHEEGHAKSCQYTITLEILYTWRRQKIKTIPEWRNISERNRYISPWNVSSSGLSSDDEYCNYCDDVHRARGRQVSSSSRIKQPILSNSKSLSPMSSSSTLDDRFYAILSQVDNHELSITKTTSSVAPWLSKHLDSHKYWQVGEIIYGTNSKQTSLSCWDFSKLLTWRWNDLERPKKPLPNHLLLILTHLRFSMLNQI